MTALFSGGGISGFLTHSAGPDEHVLVLGVTDAQNYLVIREDGHLDTHDRDLGDLYLDWRWVPGPTLGNEEAPGHWLTVEEIEAAKGASDADGPED